MTDAEKLRHLAEWFGVLGPETYDPDVREEVQADLRRIADLLDAVPPETLAAIKAGTWKAVPVEPTRAMIETAEEGYVKMYTGTPTISPERCYRIMISAAPAKPEG